MHDIRCTLSFRRQYLIVAGVVSLISMSILQLLVHMTVIDAVERRPLNMQKCYAHTDLVIFEYRDL